MSAQPSYNRQTGGKELAISLPYSNNQRGKCKTYFLLIKWETDGNSLSVNVYLVAVLRLVGLT